MMVGDTKASMSSHPGNFTQSGKRKRGVTFDICTFKKRRVTGRQKTRRAKQQLMAYSDYIDFYTVTLKPPLRLTPAEAAQKWDLDKKDKDNYERGNMSVTKPCGKVVTVDLVGVPLPETVLLDNFKLDTREVVQEAQVKRPTDRNIQELFDLLEEDGPLNFNDHFMKAPVSTDKSVLPATRKIKPKQKKPKAKASEDIRVRRLKVKTLALGKVGTLAAKGGEVDALAEKCIADANTLNDPMVAKSVEVVVVRRKALKCFTVGGEAEGHKYDEASWDPDRFRIELANAIKEDGYLDSLEILRSESEGVCINTLALPHMMAMVDHGIDAQPTCVALDSLGKDISSSVTKGMVAHRGLFGLYI